MLYSIQTLDLIIQTEKNILYSGLAGLITKPFVYGYLQNSKVPMVGTQESYSLEIVCGLPYSS